MFKSPFRINLSYLVTPSEISSENSSRNSDEYLSGRYNVMIGTDNSALSSRARYSNDVNSPKSMSSHTWVVMTVVLTVQQAVLALIPTFLFVFSVPRAWCRLAPRNLDLVMFGWTPSGLKQSSQFQKILKLSVNFIPWAHWCQPCIQDKESAKRFYSFFPSWNWSRN